MLYKRTFPKIFKPPKSKYFLITAKTILVLLSVGAVAGLFFWFGTSDFFKVKTIDCFKENFGCSQQENFLFESLYGQNIFFLQTKIHSQNIAKKNPEILKVKIAKKLPNSLKIILIPRKAVAIFKKGEEKLLVDQTGFVFARAEKTQTQLPLIITNRPLAIGEYLLSDLEKKALFLSSKLEGSFIHFGEIRLTNDDFLEVHDPGKLIATFSAQKPLTPQVDSLQYILNHSRMNQKVLKIDLRFDKPILVK